MSHLTSATLDAYLDDVLSAAERAAVATHLAECAACRAELAVQAALFTALADPTLDEISIDLRPAILAAIAPAPLGRRDWALIGAQAALVAVLALWLLSAGRLPFTGVVSNRLARAADWFALERLLAVGDQLRAGAVALPETLRTLDLGVVVGLTPLQWVGVGGLAAVLWLVGNRVLLRDVSARMQQEVRL